MADEQDFTRTSRPLAGVVLCFTSIAHDVRSDLCSKAAEMGAVWKQDLTSDATHLIVGDSDTPKYKYVARQRPDVKSMTSSFIDAVRELWIKGDDVLLAKLEEQHAFPALAGFRICGTNLSEEERKKLATLVSQHGATYNGDLTKTITHLVAATPKGKKYEFAKQWGIKVVSPEWLYESIERGMALEEQLYDPLLPETERGRDAWARPNLKKRKSMVPDEMVTADAVMARESLIDPGKRKIRKTASEKLGAQATGLWGDIIGQAQAPKAAKRDEWEEGDSLTIADVSITEIPEVEKPAVNEAKTSPMNDPHTAAQRPSEKTPSLTNATTVASAATLSNMHTSGGMFADMGFYIYNFDSEKTLVLRSTVRSFDGETYSSLPALLGARVSRFFIVVPASLPASGCPKVSDSSRAVQIATFWWIEKCMHTKEFVDPDDFPLLRPFKRLPILGFEKLSISISLFSDVDFLHMSRAIKEAGATWHDEFTRKTALLVVNHKRLSQKREKMEAAFEWNIPVVTDRWLLQCISEGECLPFDKYLLSADGEEGGVGSKNGGKAGGKAAEGPTNRKALSDCVVCVSSRLKNHEAKLRSIAISLGAKVVDSVQLKNPSPTHLLHISKTSCDTSPEYKAAFNLPGCFIVSPKWLASCKKTERRLNEHEFPAFDIPESDKSTEDSRLSASPPPEPARPQDDDSGPFIFEEGEPADLAPPRSAVKRSSPAPAPAPKRSKGSPTPNKAVMPTTTVASRLKADTMPGKIDFQPITPLPLTTTTTTSVNTSAQKPTSPTKPGTASVMGKPTSTTATTAKAALQQAPQSDLAPSIMQNLSELLKLQQQASATSTGSHHSTNNRSRRLRGRLQGRAPSGNPLPPPHAALSCASSTHSSLSIDEAGGGPASLGAATESSLSNNTNNNNSLEEYSALDDMDPNGILGSQAIHYADPEAQMEKRKILEKLGVVKTHEGDAMLKGRTLSVMTAAAEGLNTRRRTTRSAAK